MLKLRVAAAAILCSVLTTSPLCAWPADGDKPNRIERTAQKAAAATEKTAKRAGKFVEKTATRAGKFVDRTATKAGNSVKRALE